MSKPLHERLEILLGKTHLVQAKDGVPTVYTAHNTNPFLQKIARLKKMEGIYESLIKRLGNIPNFNDLDYYHEKLKLIREELALLVSADGPLQPGAIPGTSKLPPDGVSPKPVGRRK